MRAPTALAVLIALPPVLQAQTKLLRYPDIHGDRVVFCHAGDLWLASRLGGDATRLTAHPGLELFPRFSPDGAWVAFTGQYDGDEQVYVVPATGGVPRQLTFYPARGPLPQRWGFDNQVHGWSRDGQSVLFRSMREGWDLTDTRLYFAPLKGGPAIALEMPVSGAGDLSPDMQRVVYSPLTRDFRTWKRYEGGWAQDLHIYERKTGRLEPVAHHVRTERDPMWIGDAIWFVSDRDGTLNLHSWDLADKEVVQRTRSTTHDVRWASRGEDGEIVYELGGELVVYDTRTHEQATLSIRVPDDGVSSRAEPVPAGGDIEDASLSPKGERALFSARGDVHTAPIEKGHARNLTRTSGAHERLASWSPDGSQVAFVSDASGEEELWLAPQDGSQPSRQLSRGLAERITALQWAPDGSCLVHASASGRIWRVEAATGERVQLAQDPAGSGGDFSFSPDSRWLAYSAGDANELRSLWIAPLRGGEPVRVTDEMWNESNPVFSRDGRWLWFLSDREFAPQLFTGLEWNFAVNRATGIYGLALAKGAEHPFGPQSDEVTVEGAQADAAKAAQEPPKADAKAGRTEVAIDFEGLASRVVRIPVEADNYGGLAEGTKCLLTTRGGASFYGRAGDRKRELVAFDFDKRELVVLAGEVGDWSTSLDGTKLLANAGGWKLMDAGPKGKDGAKPIATDGLVVQRVPKDEWRAIFHAVWRRFRDYFYAPNMHGYDWDALKARYEPLVEHVAHRSDLNYVLGEMVAELNAGHAYVSGGEWVAPKRRGVALLGARIVLDAAAGRYRIERILKGQNEEERYRSPLTEVGVDVKEREWLLAVDGVELRPDQDPYEALRDKGDRPIELLIGAEPRLEGARKVRVRPIQSEESLNYLNWVLGRRALVDKLSNGRFGYLHIPDMGADGIREFIKWYYGQVRKEALIIDDRNNGGGNVSQMVLERLRRVLLGTAYSRHDQYARTYPGTVFTGPMICLLNENSASDGDIFPWMFRNAGLGKLVGKRSWGGVVGITDHGPLLDGGTVNVPEFGHGDASGQWAVEGVGVSPDIEVDNDPAAVLAGRDPQLERAIEELEKETRQRKAALPPRPADPVKLK